MQPTVRQFLTIGRQFFLHGDTLREHAVSLEENSAKRCSSHAVPVFCLFDDVL